MILREEFENEIKTKKGGISILFETSNQHYIEWLECKVKNLSSNTKLENSYPIHHCGNKLTVKDIFHDHCLKCEEQINK